MGNSFKIREIKQRAWDGLRTKYWSIFLILLITGMIYSMASGIASQLTRVVMLALSYTVPSLQDIDIHDSAAISQILDNMNIPELLSFVGGAYLIIGVISFVLYIFALEPIIVGRNKSIMSVDTGFSFESIGYGFTGNYINVVKTSALKYIYIFIGYLLFCIPGVILTYRYSLTGYILAENPNISSGRALEISRDMMKGNKMKFFLMKVTFIGWYLLGIMMCGFGTYFVNPYYFLSEFEMYRELRDNAIMNGTVSEAELNGFSFDIVI